MILAGLWCGRDKPAMDLFLKDFVDELQQLSIEGDYSSQMYFLSGFYNIC